MSYPLRYTQLATHRLRFESAYVREEDYFCVDDDSDDHDNHDHSEEDEDDDDDDNDDDDSDETLYV